MEHPEIDSYVSYVYDGAGHKLYGNYKELDRFLNWDMLDYGARWYDSKLQCWSTPDPLAEKYYHLSPYVYCANSPVNLIDKDGKEPDDFFSTIDEAAKDFGMYYNGISIAENVEYASSIYMVINSDNKIGFTYTSANRGDNDGATYSQAPSGAFVVAYAHTHGAYDSGYRNNEFSGVWKSSAISNKEYQERAPLMNRKQLKANDIGFANRKGALSYVATPNGSLQKYNPYTGIVERISDKLPSDKKDPERLYSISSGKRYRNFTIRKEKLIFNDIRILPVYFSVINQMIRK